MLRYLDVVLIVVGAPIFILIGVPAVGYLAGTGAWVVLRAAGVALEHYLESAEDPRREISLRLAYLIARIFLLALTVILVRQGDGKDAALAALAVIVFAFTVQLAVSVVNRPRTQR